MKTKTIEGKEQGICPICGSDDLEWIENIHDLDEVIYEFQCLNCKQYGTEIYSLNFINIQSEVEIDYELNNSNQKG